MFAADDRLVKTGEGSAPRSRCPSPPTDRAVSVLQLLAGSERSLSTRAVSRSLGFNRSTCAAILATLEARGWVERDRDDRYVPGAGLVALAGELRHRDPVVRRAEQLLDEVAADLGVGGSLTRRDGPWLTTVVLAGAGGQRRRRPPLPARLALRPPMGAVIVASSGEPGLRTGWLAAAPDQPTRTHLERFVDSIGELGFGVFRFDDVAAAISERLAAIKRSTNDLDTPAGPSALDEIGDLLLHLGGHGYTSEDLRSATGELPIAMLAAAVLDAHGEPVYEVALHVAEPAIDRPTLGLLAGRLLATADELTVTGGGRPALRGAGSWPF